MESDQNSASSCIKTVIFLIYLYSLASSRVASLDTLKPGDVLNSTSSLVSAESNFTLEFYTPFGTLNSYVAIRYTHGSAYPVWIGNRDSPVFNISSEVLTITSSGSLLIDRRGIGEDPIELYSGANSSRNMSATLLDSGNFVVKEVTSNGSVEVILWQSFDYPTDTLLRGMQLGVNHRTGRNLTLVSWLGERNPARGAFALEWDGRRVIIRRRGVVYWTSGKMKDYNASGDYLREIVFENINPKPDDFRTMTYNFTSHSSENEEYFMYSVIVDPIYNTGWRLDYEGILQDIVGPIIVRVSLCYGYNTQGWWGQDLFRGCELWEQPKCRKRRQTFVLRSGYFSFSTNNGETSDTVNSNLSLSDCREHCWNDCECVGYDSQIDPGWCRYWMGKNLRFTQSLDGSSPTIYILDSPSADKSWKRLIWILLSVVISIVLLLSVAALFLSRRIRQRRKEEKLHELLTLEGYTEAYEHGSGGDKGHDLRVFTYASVIAATNNFSSDYKLGEGGFGPVYKGKTPEGQEIAVKLLSRKSGQGLLEFKTELILISKLQHVNLVKLLGFCIHGDDKMIVYEYMPNKSLDFYLFDSSKKEQLDWRHRLTIIEGIAQGLLYLHKYSRLRIVHRDLKSGNILLDKNLNPKISDFGLARIFKQDTSEANTTRRVGTYGYMAPEYAMQGIFSYKSDVYSFGVLVLEIVSGRKNSSFPHIEGPLNLVEYAWELWNNDSALELMDPTLRSSCIIDQVQRCINIGLLCVENHAVDRPDIEDVISMLRNETSSLPLLKNPAFTRRNIVVEEPDKSSTEKLSSVELTNSEIGGR